MLKFLFISALVLAAVTIGLPVFIPLLILLSLVWLITLPIRLVFGLTAGLMHLVFGIVGAVFALVFSPILLLFMIPVGIFRMLMPRRRYTAV